MSPRPSFNDGSNPEPLDVVVDDAGTTKRLKSLRTPPSSYERQIRYSVFEFEELLDSSSIDAKGWTEIAKTIFHNYQLFDAFIILHGTDSLAYTCSALSFMLQNLGKPSPMLELQNDATDNLLGSLVIAGHFMIPEVCLFFNYRLFRGNRATKTSSSDFGAFSSPNYPPLATITSLRTDVSWQLVYRPTHIDPFTIQTNLETAHVACLRIFPGIKPEMVDGVLRVKGLRGLVLETFGAGNAPGGSDGALTKVIQDAIRRGIVVVNVTQCMVGCVSPIYAPATALGKAGVVFGHDMTSEAALTKLSYLLALPDLSYDEVTRRMTVSLRGELTESSQTLFTHPNEQLTPKLASLAALGYTITKGDLEGVREVMRGEREWLLNEADYSGNTPLHLAATGPNVEILREFLSQGASVHLRNRDGRTPLFLAAKVGSTDNILLLRRSGAHLHTIELQIAGALRRREEEETGQISEAWELAGAPVVRSGQGSPMVHSDVEQVS
ncbi:hypothetical protein GP486_001656 [Trichoglossum hirsutum]|uniref:asparaginase n=1 Tax=Trichoglossum hirsutum TaxID=265104 RepID=A0A9P8RSV3_9PEZI|nr:hypothetical protein GP486_001656 [Trichoglossum hirsutum]